MVEMFSYQIETGRVIDKRSCQYAGQTESHVFTVASFGRKIR